jgi:penicillin-binding protein 2
LALIGVCLCVIFGRLWILQVVKHDEFAEKAHTYRVSSISLPAPRGLIYDRSMNLLAGVKPRIIITAKAGIVKKNLWVLDKLSAMLAVPKKKLEGALKAAALRPYMDMPIYLGATVVQATRIAEAGDDLPGIGVDTQSVRYYPDPVSFSHVLGYVWTPDSDDVSRLQDLGLKPAQYVGKSGLEYAHEADLMGTPGAESVEVDARRRPVRVIGRDSPTPGNELVLTIDARLQKKAIELMQGKRGAVVMLDPRNGEVICLVSSPVYDVSAYEGGGNQAMLEQLNTDEDRPLLNRAIAGYYSPGSTFKIVDSIAAAQSGVFSPNRTYYCPGYFRVGNRKVACLGHHGLLSFQAAFARSCNTYFASWADSLGPDALGEAAESAGLGQKTGLDVRSEKAGLVPTPEWKEHRKHNPGKWYRGDTVNMGIGQGELRVTPLQMACIAALVGNEGVSYRPHLVKTEIAPGADGQKTPTKIEVMTKVELPSSFWRTIKDAMVAVIEGKGGTAHRAQIPGIVWGGKTGSTEHHKGKLTHGWFIGVAPIDNPKVAIAVLVEESGHGGEVSAPIAQELVKMYLMPPQEPPRALANAASAASATAASAGRPSER